jgi:hypothetical protein
MPLTSWVHQQQKSQQLLTALRCYCMPPAALLRPHQPLLLPMHPRETRHARLCHLSPVQRRLQYCWQLLRYVMRRGRMNHQRPAAMLLLHDQQNHLTYVLLLFLHDQLNHLRPVLLLLHD